MNDVVMQHSANWLNQAAVSRFLLAESVAELVIDKFRGHDSLME